MPSNTPNKGFYLPDNKESGWDDEKNSDWQLLDQVLQNIPNDGDLSTTFSDGSLDVSFASVDTERLSNVYDHIVSTVEELEALPSNLSDGDVAMVGRPETPYRLSQWLDLDGLSDVTIYFESKHAENGEPCVKVADGADVGMFRVGETTTCNNLLIDGFGFDGNHPNQDQSVQDLHAVRLTDVTDATVKNFYAERTSPYHAHNEGGTPIRIQDNATNITIRDFRCDDVGDRSVEIVGTNVTVTHGICTNGFDRHVTCIPGSENVEVSHLICGSQLDGSCFGIGGPAVDGDVARNIRISNCISYNATRNLVQVLEHSHNVRVENSTIYNAGTNIANIDGANIEEVTIADVTAYNPGESGAVMSGTKDPDADPEAELIGVKVFNAGTSGVRLSVGKMVLKNCVFRGSDNGSAGIFTQSRGEIRANGCIVKNFSKEGVNLNGGASGNILTNCEIGPNGQVTDSHEINIDTPDVEVVNNIIPEKGPNSLNSLLVSGSGSVVKDNVVPRDGAVYQLGAFAADTIISDNTPRVKHDVRTFTGVPEGTMMYHDPSFNGDANTEGEAQFIGGSWISLVDGSTIA